MDDFVREMRLGIGYLFLFGTLSHLLFAWFSYRELQVEKRYHGKLRLFLRRMLILFFLSMAGFLFYEFAKWGVRGFPIVLP